MIKKEFFMKNIFVRLFLGLTVFCIMFAFVSCELEDPALEVTVIDIWEKYNNYYGVVALVNDNGSSSVDIDEDFVALCWPVKIVNGSFTGEMIDAKEGLKGNEVPYTQTGTYWFVLLIYSENSTKKDKLVYAASNKAPQSFGESTTISYNNLREVPID
jgi:hypothetical protein